MKSSKIQLIWYINKVLKRLKILKGEIYMIDKICSYLTDKIRKEMPEVNDERAEVIMYGLQNLIGELPKGILILLISYFFGIIKLTVLAILIIAPYRGMSGGVHLKTHIGCIITSFILYNGPALFGKYIVLDGYAKIIIALIIWSFCMIMLKLYAPADTENVPILREKERKQKQILSFVILSIEFIIAIFIDNPTISGIIIFGDFIQTLTITRVAYNITKNRYGHEVYANN